MRIYDISNGIFSTPVYEGDPCPRLERVRGMEQGDGYQLSCLHACVHTGTHVDAPSHFLEEGGSVEALPLGPYIGECAVVSVPEGPLTGEQAETIVEAGCQRILLKSRGRGFLSQSAAFVLSDPHVLLVGTDALTVGEKGREEIAHRQLLGQGTGVLEGLNLSAVPDGKYFLFAPPVLIEGSDAAFTRAVLLEGFFYGNL